MHKKKIKAKILGGLLFLTMFLGLVGRFGDMIRDAFQPSTDRSATTTISIPQSVHFAERTLPIQHIVVHSFALPVEEMLMRLNKLGVSTHYLISIDGHVTRLVPEDKIAWHAGVSFWRGITGLNATSIGIELQNDTLGQTPFTEAQLSAFQILVRDLMYRYQIDQKNIVSHSDIAPTRKVDVGHAFPWQKMALLGIGLWPTENVSVSQSQNIKELLAQIGYDVTDEEKALLAFERRFMPELIQKDPDIAHLEENLITQKPVKNAAVIRRLNEVAQAYK